MKACKQQSNWSSGKACWSHLNIELSWRRSLEVWVARVFSGGLHDEDCRQLWAGHSSAKEAGEGHCVSVDAGRLYRGVPQCLSCTPLPHHHCSHHLVPPIEAAPCTHSCLLLTLATALPQHRRPLPLSNMMHTLMSTDDSGYSTDTVTDEAALVSRHACFHALQLTAAMALTRYRLFCNTSRVC